MSWTHKPRDTGFPASSATHDKLGVERVYLADHEGTMLIYNGKGAIVRTIIHAARHITTMEALNDALDRTL